MPGSQATLITVLLLLAGCAQPRAKTADVVFFVPGAIGDGGWYSSLRSGLRDGGMERPLVTVSWGAPKAMFALNFSNAGIHENAEKKLASVIADHSERFPEGRIDLIGHSAGCGVILGAMRKLDNSHKIHSIVLIAPSVSPAYDINHALLRSTRIDAFISERDTTFLSWRTSNFGSYDNVKTKAAGHLGFDLGHYPPALAEKITQHRYSDEWKTLGNDGGHFGSLSRKFVKAHIAPLLQPAQRDHPR